MGNNKIRLPRFKSLSQLLLLTIVSSVHTIALTSRAGEFKAPHQLLTGFKVTADASVTDFQPLLSDSSGNYSLGFRRVNRNQLILSVIHVSSSVPVWSANMTRSARWAGSTQFFFNGSLVLSDSHTGAFWSTDTVGDGVWLSDTSNLQIRKVDGGTVLWQSFDFPTDTLVENQNFTSTVSLVSSNGVYSMRLGPDFIGLYAKFKKSDPEPGQIYLRHRALEAKADIIEGQGPIYAVLKSDGYLGMFQNGSIPVDVQSFNSFQQNVSGIRRVRIEDDGNLKGYYWTGSSWILDYQAISDQCELPSPCGSYSLCTPGHGCSCLDNRTAHRTGGCEPPENQISGDFCSVRDNRYTAMRKSGVELPFKELMGYEIKKSFEQCETECEGNCTCWGVVYSNFSGFCYILDYPIQTLVGVEDDTKVGYFKVREGIETKRVDAFLGLGLGLLFGAILIFAGVMGLGCYRLRSRGVERYIEEDGLVGVGAYQDLGAASFRSIELCEHLK